MTIQDQLRNHILEEHLKGENPEELQNDTNLITSGILDSFAIVLLVSYIENSYQIKIDFKDINVENFSTLLNLEKLILRYQSSKS